MVQSFALHWAALQHIDIFYSAFNKTSAVSWLHFWVMPLPQGRNALSITQMYLTIMENPFACWKVMHSNQQSCSDGPKVVSSGAARKVNAQQQQCFTIIYMKRNKTTELEVTVKTEGVPPPPRPRTSDSEIFCLRILLKLTCFGEKGKEPGFVLSFLFPPLSFREVIFFKKPCTNSKVGSQVGGTEGLLVFLGVYLTVQSNQEIFSVAFTVTSENQLKCVTFIV